MFYFSVKHAAVDKPFALVFMASGFAAFTLDVVWELLTLQTTEQFQPMWDFYLTEFQEDFVLNVFQCNTYTLCVFVCVCI